MELPNPQEMASLLARDDGVEQLMKQPVFENEYGQFSQAEMMADVINILRMDARQFGLVHGVDVEVEKITPDKMAWALAEMVDGNTRPLVAIFNDIEDKHHEVMEDVMVAEDFDSYLRFKEGQLYTTEHVESESPEEVSEALAEYEADDEAGPPSPDGEPPDSDAEDAPTDEAAEEVEADGD